METGIIFKKLEDPNRRSRVREFDFLKGILILLVIAFHLVYFSTTYPYAKEVVYTFHMPAFLLLSGYLMNFEKDMRGVLRTFLWLLIPYVVMETSYVVMASILPIREHIETLTLSIFLDKLLLHPIGPYWYLHTLVICGALWYALRSWKTTTTPVNILLFISVALLAGVGKLLTPACALYFLLGVIMREFKLKFVRFFAAGGGWTLLLFAGLITRESHLDMASLMGMLIVYTFIGAGFFLYHYIPGGGKRLMELLGRNSLQLYLFSPIFTILCKYLVPFLTFDTTGIIFLVSSLFVCVAGSLAIAKMLEYTGVSLFLFGRKKVVV